VLGDRISGAVLPARSRATSLGHRAAVVIGGGLAGSLAAWALHDHAESTVVVERDHYPGTAEPRAGVPQAHHAHLLLEAGHRALEALMPGIRAQLVHAGATPVAMSRELRWLTAAGWMADHDTDLQFLSATRPLLDDTVLRYVQQAPSVQFLTGAEVVGLLGSSRAVTGVRVRERGCGGGTIDIPAELVVDASGRRSSAPEWLLALGCRRVREDRVDAGIAYTSRLYRRPPGDLGFLALYLQTHPEHPRTGSLLPVEGGRWIVSLGGMRGAEPRRGESGFAEALTQMRDPLLRETLDGAEPASAVRGFRPGPSVRRHYEHHTTPDGFLAVGDAVAAFNPVYGQGCSMAAMGALHLRTAVRNHGNIGHTAARAARRSIAAANRTAWWLASSEDGRFAATSGGSGFATATRLQHRALDLVLHRATTDPAVTKALHRVLSMVAPPTTLLRPVVLQSVLRSGGD